MKKQKLEERVARLESLTLCLGLLVLAGGQTARLEVTVPSRKR